MDKTTFLNDLQDKLKQVMANTPAADVERNVKTLVAQGLAKFELVTREEFDTQRDLLVHLRARVNELQTRVDALEQQRQPQ